MSSGAKNIIIGLLVALLVGMGVYVYMENKAEQEVEDKEDVEVEEMEEEEEVEEDEEEEMEEDEEEEDDEEDEDEEVSEVPEGDFIKDQQGSFHGKIYLTGYATFEERTEGFCDPDFQDCATFEYVMFNYFATDNDAFNEYMELNTGNSFVGEGSIAIGCKEGDSIRYWNDSDQTGMVENTLSADLSDAILNSSERSPIVLELERYKYIGGRGAPDCYSHISRIAEWNSAE